MPNQLVNILVKNISLVDKAANGRRFLLLKAEGGQMEKREKESPATNEVEKRIAERINRNPVTVTRAIAMQEVFTADPALYERYRAEATIGRDGQILDRNPSSHNVGIGKSAESMEAEAEVLAEMGALMSKSDTLTVEQARDEVFRRNLPLYERWRQQSYA
jgi:hypothetical protein